VGAAKVDPVDAFAHKLAASIRLLLSNRSGDVTAALAGVQRLLQTKFDKHAIADRLEKVQSDADNQKIEAAVKEAYALGRAEGIKQAQASQRGTNTFRNTDGKLEFDQVALYVQREMHRLRYPEKHREFLDKMALYAVEGYEPSKRQGKYLFDLFVELGGKIE
jgi:hypothetical protein